MLGPSAAIRLRKMIVPHVPGGRAQLESGLGAKPPYAGVTIAIAAQTGATHLCHGQATMAAAALAEACWQGESRCHIRHLQPDKATGNANA